MIKKADKQDIQILEKLAMQVYQNSTEYDLYNEFLEAVFDENKILLLEYENDVPVGFAECSLRYDYVEGTETSPVGYLEGIFVVDKFRKKGYAKELLQQCEIWAKKKGCKQFASDCELNNLNSIKFHKAMNFVETNKIVCFVKQL